MSEEHACVCRCAGVVHACLLNNRCHRCLLRETEDWSEVVCDYWFVVFMYLSPSMTAKDLKKDSPEFDLNFYSVYLVLFFAPFTISVLLKYLQPFNEIILETYLWGKAFMFHGWNSSILNATMSCLWTVLEEEHPTFLCHGLHDSSILYLATQHRQCFFSRSPYFALGALPDNPQRLLLTWCSGLSIDSWMNGWSVKQLRFAVCIF